MNALGGWADRALLVGSGGFTLNTAIKKKKKEEDSLFMVAGTAGDRAVADRVVLRTVKGERQARPPIWFMRQAGRYLPEYRKIRLRAPDFLTLCYTPELASEVTLQPVRRFDIDAAILFSDILVIPDALGQQVRFEEGEGPLLEPLDEVGIARLATQGVTTKLTPVLETVARVRARLDDSKTLIGFCGAPWTLATYMIGGRGSSDQSAARKFALNHPKAFARLLDVLVEVSADYLVAQLRAGADVVQIFESWAQNLDEDMFVAAVIEPNQRIVAAVRRQVPGAAMIGFPRGAGANLRRFAEATGFDALGLDTSVPLGYAAKELDGKMAVQGNLDPLRLVAGGAQMERRIDDIVAAFADRPHVFNLGHGIVPETPIDHVERMIKRVRGN